MKTSELQVENVDAMSEQEESAFWRFFGAKLGCDDGATARSHLADGDPIYYRETTTPANSCVKEYPDGRRELVRFDLNGEHVIAAIASA